MRPHWYLTIHYECPLCGWHHSIRERQYTPKPKDPADRHRYKVDYDYCDVL